MYYWQGKQDDPTGWIYKTQADIETETGLSRTEQETARRLLRQRNLIKERYSGLPRRLEFWLDEDELENRWTFFLEHQVEKPLIEDTKLTQKPDRRVTTQPRYLKKPVGAKELELLPSIDSAIMQDSCIKACRNPTDNNAEMLQSSWQETNTIESRNPTIKSAQILQASKQEPCTQVSSNPASNLYTQITTQTTSRDYNTYPPYPPPEEKQPGERANPRKVEKLSEEELANNHGCEEQFQAKTHCLETKNPAGDNCSVAPQDHPNRYQKNQPQYSKHLDGSDHLPWDTTKRGVFDSEFEKHMARSLMQYPAYQNLMFGELLTKVRKHISAGRYDLKRREELNIEWEAMQSSHAADDFSAATSSLTAKAAARRAKIARAIGMEVS
ncbi:MAG: hypothetical protein JO235_07730 [Chroococcidiopsidaceae cyanobacterium CP_BM_RX_35]|nr:hypothetical protein [Chroococcidiopsidaceae cyanobacterium CP_BM_RX_35]